MKFSEHAVLTCTSTSTCPCCRNHPGAAIFITAILPNIY